MDGVWEENVEKPLTVREMREVASFHQVELRFFGQLHIAQGPHSAVEIEGDPDVVAKVRTVVEGETLVLEVGESWLERLTSGVLLVAQRPLHYRVTTPDLSRVAVSGTGRVEANGWVCERLEVSASGAAEIRMQKLGCDELAAAISGRGSFEFSGRSDRLLLRISGSGDVDAGELACNEADVRISGQGNALLRVSERLDVRLSGVGQVRYHGSPQVTQRVSGVGSVEQLSNG
jgi:hypothetical protein